jgi:hypothetical protein
MKALGIVAIAGLYLRVATIASTLLSSKLTGTTAKSFPEGGTPFFNVGDNAVAQVAEFLICTISKIDISRPVFSQGASCELIQQEGSWKVIVGTNSFCRVTCFE